MGRGKFQGTFNTYVFFRLKTCHVQVMHLFKDFMLEKMALNLVSF